MDGRKVDRVTEGARQVDLERLPHSPWRMKLREIFYPQLQQLYCQRRKLPAPKVGRIGNWFQILSLVFVLLSLCTCAAFDPLNREQSWYFDTMKYKALFTVESIISFFFLVEIAIRTISLGFRATLDLLHVLDNAIVLIAIGSLLAEFSGYPNRIYGIVVLRSMRLLKPLGGLKRFPAAAVVVNSISGCITRVTDATLLFLLFLVLMSIAAITQFQGRLRDVCVNNAFRDPTVSHAAVEFAEAYAAFAVPLIPFSGFALANSSHGIGISASTQNENSTTIEDFVCGGWFDQQLMLVLSNNFTTLLAFPDINSSATRLVRSVSLSNYSIGLSSLACSQTQRCDRNPGTFLEGYPCPYGYSCEEVRNPYSGYVGFDNIGMSLLTIFTCVTQQLWYEASYMARDATDLFAIPFFDFLVIVGGFLIVSLIVVLVTIEFEEVQEQERQRVARKRFVSFKGGLMALAFQVLQRRNPKSAEGEVPSKTDQEKKPLRIALWREKVRSKVTNTKWFAFVSTLVILANVVMLAWVNEGMPEDSLARISNANVVFTLLFTVEQGLRIFAEKDVSLYLRRSTVILDNLVIVSCWVDHFLDDWNLAWMRVLRIPHAFHILQVVPGVYHYIVFIGRAIRSSPMVIVLLLMFLIVFGIATMQLLGGTFCNMMSIDDALDDPFSVDNTLPDCPMRPRTNFDSFYMAVIAAFQVLTADDWNNVMYNAMAARGPLMGIVFSLFFYSCNFIVLSLLVGVMLSVKDPSRKEEIVSVLELEGGTEDENEPPRSPDTAQRSEGQQRSRRVTKFHQAFRSVDNEFIERWGDGADESNQRKFSLFSLGKGEEPATTDGEQPMVRIGDSQVADTSNVEECPEVLNAFKVYFNSVWYKVVNGCVTAVCLISLAMRRPVDAPDSQKVQIVSGIDLAVAVFFFIETLLHIWYTGFLGRSGESTYLRRSKWNIAEFTLTSLGVLTQLLRLLHRFPSVYQVLLCFQSLRALLLCRHFRQQLIALNALWYAMFTLRYIIAAGMIIYFAFGVIGVQLLHGKLFYCDGEGAGANLVEALALRNSTNIAFDTPIVLTPWAFLGKEACISAGGSWVSPSPNFDDIYSAMFSLFVLSILEQWAALMYRAMDYSGDGMAPVPNANALVSVYFIVFVFITGFLLANIFTTILIDAYNHEKRTASAMKSILLAQEHHGWLLTNRRILRYLPASAKKSSLRSQTSLGLVGVRDKLRTFTRSPRFIVGSLGCVLVNFILMCIEHDPQPEGLDDFLTVAGIFFTVLFVAEAAMKIAAESFRVYIASQWNRLDFFVCFTSVVVLILRTVVNPSALGFVNALRILRLVRLLKGFSQVGSLVAKFSRALFQLIHVVVVIPAFSFIFTIFGVRFLGRVKWGPYNADTINFAVNFANFGDAMNLLLRLSTGGNWVPLLKSCLSDAPGCDPRLGDCGPASPLPQVFFVIFLMFSTYVLRNLLIAVMLDSFSAASENRGITKIDAAMFFQSWCAIDENVQLKIPCTEVLPFIRSLPHGFLLGLRSLPTKPRIQQELRLLTMLRIRFIHTRTVSFKNLVDCLCRVQYQGQPPEARDFIHDILQESNNEEHRKKGKSKWSILQGALVGMVKEKRPADPRQSTASRSPLIKDDAMEYFVKEYPNSQLFRVNAAMLLLIENRRRRRRLAGQVPPPKVAPPLKVEETLRKRARSVKFRFGDLYPDELPIVQPPPLGEALLNIRSVENSAPWLELNLEDIADAELEEQELDLINHTI
jgi:hypothetical protein